MMNKKTKGGKVMEKLDYVDLSKGANLMVAAKENPDETVQEVAMQKLLQAATTLFDKGASVEKVCKIISGRKEGR